LNNQLAFDLDTPQDNNLVRVRYSMRAKRLSLSVHHDGNVEVLAPAKKFRKPAMARIEKFISDNKNWITDTQAKYLSKTKSTNSNTSSIRPTEIDLPFVNEKWRIVYTHNVKRLKEHNNDSAGSWLELPISKSDHDIAILLGKWLKKKAEVVMQPILSELSDQTELRFRKLSVRGQKTRWGSCSAKGNISLNYCILFLSPRFGRYVMLHELCHLQEFNHSKHFWALVKRYEPQYKKIDKTINDYWMQLPKWLDLRFKTKDDDENVIYIKY